MIIILYVMDSLRPDFLSCYGYPKETSPNIDRLVGEGVLFLNAFSNSTWTRASAASLLSSTYPSVHGVLTLDDRFPPSIPTLPEDLKRNGVRTIALTSMKNVSPSFSYEKGFDAFVEVYKEEWVIQGRRMMVANNIPISTSEDINKCLFPFLERGPEDDMFIFVWSLDTHDPYFHRDPRLARFCPPSEKMYWSKDIKNMHSEAEVSLLKALYEDMIYHSDHHIGALVEWLKQRGLFDQTLFILTSDHGESFGEHGHNSHGGMPYDEVLRVPLLMKFPRSQFCGQVHELVQLIDVVPTVLEVTGVKTANPFLQGKSLLPLLLRQEKVNDVVFAETQLKAKLPRSRAIRNRDFKYIEIEPGEFDHTNRWKEIVSRVTWSISKPRMFFSLKDDPAEKVNLVKQEKKKAEGLRGRMEHLLRESRELSRRLGDEKKVKIEMDDETAKQLKALGYFD